jgi:hypothetical protein
MKLNERRKRRWRCGGGTPGGAADAERVVFRAKKVGTARHRALTHLTQSVERFSPQLGVPIVEHVPTLLFAFFKKPTNLLLALICLAWRFTCRFTCLLLANAHGTLLLEPLV